MTFANMNSADPITAAPAMGFDLLRGDIHLVGLLNRDIHQLEPNHAFMYLQVRNPQIAWLFFRVPELFGKPVSRGELRQIDENVDRKLYLKS
jgi:hypothetical protein